MPCSLKQLNQPKYSFPVVLLGVLFLTILGDCGGSSKPAVFTALISITTLGCLWASKQEVPIIPVLWILGFTAYTAVLTTVSTAPEYSRHDLALIVNYALLLVGLLFSFKDKDNRLGICRLIRFTGLIISVLALIQFLTHNSSIPTWYGLISNQYADRVSSFFSNPNYLGEYCAICLIIAFVSFSYKSRFRCVLAGSEFLLLLSGIVLSGSRGAILASWIGLLLASTFLWKNRKRVWLAGALLLIQVTLLMAHGEAIHRTKAILATTTDPKTFAPSQGESLRMACWKGAILLWQKDPVTGVGPHLFTLRWHEVQPENVQANAHKVHSIWLQTLCEYGVIGFALLCFAVSYLSIITWRNRHCLDVTQLAGVCALAAILGYETFDFSFYTPTLGVLALCLVALVASQIKPTKGGIYLVYAFTLASLVWAGVNAFNVQKGDQLIAQAFSTKDIKTMRQSLLAAQHYQPKNDSLDLWLTRLETQEQLRLPKEQRNWELVRQHAVNGIANNRYALELRYLLAMSFIDQDRSKAETYIKAMMKVAPNSSKSVGFAVIFYRAIGNLNEAAKWENRMNYLLPFKVNSAPNAGNGENP